MDGDLLILLLATLTVACALNLFLTFRLARTVAALGGGEEAHLTVPAGEPLPPFEGTAIATGQRVGAELLRGSPLVLIFLSSGCPACREKVSELAAILPGTRAAAVALWVLAADSRSDLAEIVGESPLRERLLQVDPAALHSLNPRHAAPAYIFVDEQMVVRASNYLGDEDWRTFAAEMLDLARRG